MVRDCLVCNLGLVSGVRGYFGFRWNVAKARSVPRGSIFQSDLPGHVFHSTLPAYRRTIAAAALVGQYLGFRCWRRNYLRNDLPIGTFGTIRGSESDR